MNRAKLTGIASALKAKCACTHIPAQSACSLSLIRNQLLFLEYYRRHMNVKLLVKMYVFYLTKIQAKRPCGSLKKFLEHEGGNYLSADDG